MAGFINTALFGIYPYVCLAVFALGSIFRYDHEPYTWRARSSQLLRRRQMIWGSNLFHVGILVIFLGHLGGLLTPIAVFEFLGIPHTAKQILAISVGGVAGLICLVGAALLLHRRLFDARVRETSNFGETGILVILTVQLLLGLSSIFVSLGHLDGEEMVKLMTWAQGIVTLKGDAASHVADVHPIFKLHLFLGLTIFLLFPFTRLVHALSAPVRYLWRGHYQIVRTRIVLSSPRTVRLEHGMERGQQSAGE